MKRAAHWLEIPEIEPSDRILDLGASGASCASAGFVYGEGIFLTSDLRHYRSAREAGVACRLVDDYPDVSGFTCAVYEPPQREAKDRIFETIDGAFRALDIGGTLWLAGRRNRGVESYRRRMEAVFGNVRQTGRADRTRVYVSRKTRDTPGAGPVDPFTSFEAATPSGETLSFRSRAGVFSSDDLDPGSDLLVRTIGSGPCGTVLDVGCGAGTIGLSLIAGVAEAVLTQVDTSALATWCAERNAKSNGLDARCRTVTSDLYSDIGDEAFDLIVSNPPFHEGSSVSRPLIEGAARRLREGGRLCLVVMREGPYLKSLEVSFGQVEVLAREAPYSVLTACKPRPS